MTQNIVASLRRDKPTLFVVNVPMNRCSFESLSREGARAPTLDKGEVAHHSQFDGQ